MTARLVLQDYTRHILYTTGIMSLHCSADIIMTNQRCGTATRALGHDRAGILTII